MHLERNITYECLMRRPVGVVSSFKWSSQCKKKMFYDGEIIIDLKRILKALCYY